MKGRGTEVPTPFHFSFHSSSPFLRNITFNFKFLYSGLLIQRSEKQADFC